MNGNENFDTTYQNLWDTVKVELKGKFLTVNDFLRKKKSQINNLTFHIKILEKEPSKPTTSRRKEIINIRVKINEIQNRKTIEKVNQKIVL